MTDLILAAWLFLSIVAWELIKYLAVAAILVGGSWLICHIIDDLFGSAPK